MSLPGLSFASCEPVIFLYNFIVVIHYSAVPQLLLKKVCVREANNTTSCDDLKKIPDYIHQEASKWWLYLILCFQIPAIFTILVWGPVTDVVGRKKALMCVPFADAACSLVFILSSYYIKSHQAYLMIGYFAISLFGELQGVITFCYAYTADITKDKVDQRTPRMALVEVSLYFSAIPAGLLSGYLIQTVGFVSVFGLTMFVDFLLFLYIFCLLASPEGNPDDHEAVHGEYLLQDDVDRSSREEQENDLLLEDKKAVTGVNNNLDDNLTGRVGVAAYLQRLRKLGDEMLEQKIIIPLTFSFALVLAAFLGELLVQTLFLKQKPFLFSPELIGYYVAAQSASRGIGTIVITQLSYRLLNLKDVYLIVFSNVSQLISYVAIGFSRSTLAVFLSSCLGGFAIPISMATIRSVVTKRISKDKYGTLLSVLGSVNVISAMVATVVTRLISDNRSSLFTGIVYFGYAGITAMSLVIVIVTYTIMKLTRNSYDEL